MPSLDPRKRLLRYTAFGLALAMLASVGAATVWSFQRTVARFDWVEHTYQVIARIEEYRATLRSAESAGRGYRLSGNPAMRDEFTTNAALVERQLTALAARVSDSPVQSDRVRRLKALSRTRLQLSREAIDAGQSRSASALRRAARAAQASAAVEALTYSMLQTERRLLVARRDLTLSQGRVLIAFGAGGTAFAILLLALLMRGLRAEIRHSRELEERSRETTRRLEHSLDDFALISEQRRVLARYAGMLQ
ncbi:MAG: CHASE3 domain-containing protein, partial [Luteimonas sp.]